MVWAGPYCGRLLAQLGAEVIKVEGPVRRDGTRPPDGWEGCSGTFADLNADKQSLVLNLATEAGRSAFLRLAAVTDVVVESFTPRVMPNLGLDFENLTSANPVMVMLSMPAFPTDGPWASYVAYGGGLELATGLWRTGISGRPEAAPVPFLDYLAGAYGAAGVVASLIARENSGNGCHVEVAQRDVALHVLETARSPIHPAVPVYPSLDAARLARDPHLSARGLFGWEDLDPADVQGCQHFARPPWRLGPPLPTEAMLDHCSPGQRAPAFGADSVRVLCGVGGMERSEVDALVRDRIVLSDPVILTEGKDPFYEPGTDPSQDDRFRSRPPP
jgi:crotonobetainyl-CoA:carnitine CoA-transferase CaiB-like acyl-CoA transferase